MGLFTHRMIGIFLNTASVFGHVRTAVFVFGCAGSSLLLGLSAVVESRGYSLVVVCRLLVEVASLFWPTGSRVQAHRLSYSTACGTSLDQGSSP